MGLRPLFQSFRAGSRPRWLIRSGCGSKFRVYWYLILAGLAVCHQGCAYTMLQIVQRPGVCSADYGSVYYKKNLKSFDKSRAQSRLRASFCRDITIGPNCAECDVKQYSLTHFRRQNLTSIDVRL